MKNLKTITALTKEETQKALNLQWGTDSKMIDYIKSEYDLYKTQDNFIIEIKKSNKLNINKTLWYDDELPQDQIPTNNKQNFIDNNMYNCEKFDYLTEEKNNNSIIYFVDGYTNNKANIYSISSRKPYNQDNFEKRPLTDDEVQDFLTIYKDQKEKYIERLNKYYNKYSKNLRVVGYWVNQ